MHLYQFYNVVTQILPAQCASSSVKAERSPGLLCDPEPKYIPRFVDSEAVQIQI